MNPEIISLHYTTKCGRNCPHCYLMKQSSSISEILKDEWLKLPEIAASIDSIKKIAIAINYYNPDSIEMYEECKFALTFLKKCYKFKNRFLVDITTDIEVVSYLLNSFYLCSVDVFSISIDSNKTKKDNLETFYISSKLLIKRLKENGVNSVNANFLLTKECIKWLDDGVLDRLSSIFDTVHIIFEKPFIYTEDEFYSIINILYKYDTFENEKYIIDPCILFKLGLVNHCHSTTKIIDINPYGSISGCAYNHSNPIGKISNLSDFAKLLNKSDTSLVFECPYMEFKLNADDKT
jgi:MoaA/NifB/PqqE/SkfB family radical SAM enzyme